METYLSTQEVKMFMSEELHENYYSHPVASQLVKVINGYGKRNGFLDRAAGVIYRIWNAVKGIFGKSDFQIAHKLIKNTMLNDPVVYKNYIFANTNDVSKIKFNQSVNKRASKHANAIINDFIRLTFSMNIKDKKSISDEIYGIEELNFENYIHPLYGKFNAFKLDIES